MADPSDAPASHKTWRVVMPLCNSVVCLLQTGWVSQGGYPGNLMVLVDCHMTTGLGKKCLADKLVKIKLSIVLKKAK